MLRSIVLASFGFLLFVGLVCPAPAFADSDKVALVIGNAKYTRLGMLNNTTNDAKALAAALTGIGFETQLVLDANEAVLRSAIKSFSRRSSGKSLAVVFYAGHGVQVDGENFILPTDFDVPNSESDIRISGLKVDDLLGAVRSKVKIIFLDACRDNPVLTRGLSTGGRGIAVQGLAPIRTADVSADTGVFIAFATAAGSVALDGDGSHSPFTQALLDNIQRPVSVDDMFSLVTKEVAASTHDAQRPYKYASLESVICLTGQCGASAAPPAPAATSPATISVSDGIGQWLWVQNDKQGHRFQIDPMSKRQLGDRTLMRSRMTSADGVETVLGENAFDCKNNAASVYEAHTYRSNIRVEGMDFVSPADIAPLTPIAPGSIFSSIAAFACGQVAFTPEVSKDVVFSDGWIGVTSDKFGDKYSVLPSTIQKTSEGVVAVVKREAEPGRAPIPADLMISVGDAFSNELPVVIQNVLINCERAEFGGSVTEGWSTDGKLLAKQSSVQRVISKITADLVSAGIGNYVCTKAGERLVLQ